MLYFNQKQFQLLYFVQDNDLPLGSLGEENDLTDCRGTSSSSDTEENFTDSDNNLSIYHSAISSSEPEDTSTFSDNTIDINYDMEVTEPNVFQHTSEADTFFWKSLHQSHKCHQLTNPSQICTR